VCHHFDVLQNQLRQHMSRFLIPSISILVMCLPTGSQALAASVIYDNSGSAWTSNVSVSSYFYQAQSFRTESEPSYLHTVSLGLLANDGTEAPFFVQLFDGLYPGLGTPIATLSGPTNPGTGMITYSTSGSVLLAPDSTYWVLARAYGATDSGTYYGWRIADNDPSVGLDSGRNIYYADTTQQWVGPSGPGDLVMTVEVVPEPSVMLLGVFAASALVVRRRRHHGETQAEQAGTGQPATRILLDSHGSYNL
jgi:hypothetical protein